MFTGFMIEVKFKFINESFAYVRNLQPRNPPLRLVTVLGNAFREYGSQKSPETLKKREPYEGKFPSMSDHCTDPLCFTELLS